MKFRMKFIKTYNNYEVEFDSVLEALDQSDVFKIYKFKDGFEIIEQCDSVFGLSVTKEQLLILADEIRELALGKEKTT